MNNYFARLFHFNDWANQSVGNSLSDQNIADDDCIKLISHLLNAQSNWYGRITGQQQDQPTWQVLELSQVISGLEENGTAWAKYLESLDQKHFTNWIAYNNMAGQPQKNTVQDILVHVVNHATYHRGQIVRRIRELGFTPPSTDYIQYSRLFPGE